MSHITIGKSGVVSTMLTISRWGAPVADIVLATSVEIPDQFTMAIGAMSVKMAKVRAAPFAGVRSLRAVGGFGGWRKTLKPRAYSHKQGVKLRTILVDAAREAGETIVVPQDRVIGTAYVRERAAAERVLETLVNRQWWIDLDGTTRVDARPTGPIKSAFTVNSWSGGRGRFEIATEVYQDWLPGRTFSAPTVTTPQTISTVQLTADNDGKLRLIVLTGDTAEDRLTDDMRALIRAESPSQTFAGHWQYKIAGIGAGTIDCTPLDRNGPLPDLTGVPLLPGLMGEAVTALVGKTCVIVFLDQSPTNPRCVHIDGLDLTVAIDAQLAVRLGAGVRPAIGAGDLAGGIWPCVPTQVKVLV